MTRAAPLRLLMTTDAVGGVWTYALDLADGLAAHDVSTTLVVLGPAPTPAQRLAARAVPRLELIETGLPLDWMARETAEIGEAAAVVAGLARGAEADVVHLNSPALAAWRGFDAPVVGACHSCPATWWRTVRDGPMPYDFDWRSRAVWRGLIACDALIAPTAAFAEATSRTHDVPRPFVVHNGRRAPTSTARTARERLVFTSGRLWDDGKNLAALDAAAACLDAPVYAAGPLENPNGGCASPRHVQALGRLGAAEIEGWLARTPVFASAALYEPFGLGVLEAAQAGCALVLSDIASFRELWAGAAILVPAHDHRRLARELQGLLDDPARAARLGAAARERARTYTPEDMSAGVLGIYRLLMQRAARPRREAAA
jgi:glycogen(starch) synthase